VGKKWRAIIEQYGIEAIDTENDGNCMSTTILLACFYAIITVLFCWYTMINIFVAIAGENICERFG
jgi:hypothetical protein